MPERFSRMADWFRRPKKNDESQEPDRAEHPAPLSGKEPLPESRDVLSDAEEDKPRSKPEIRGVITDQNLLSWYYREFHDVDVQPVATDKFMERSKKEYNAAWLARELIQNFVDENEEHPYSLDGVDISNETIDQKTGMVRFLLDANWKFEDSTGLTSLHSAKTEKRKTAGGNGIGLKQVALRLLRDFGVENFEVNGENWTVHYRLAKKDEINQQLKTSQYDERLKHDWLLAEISSSENQGRCSYVIDSNNQEVIQALKELSNIGVCESNPYLQKPDFKNLKGALKWLSPSEAGDESQGRLFVNGQVMNYKSKGKSAEDYWRGPELVTIQLDDVDYDMSIDRPPINAYELNRYMGGLVGSMSEEEALEQLEKSEHIWNAVSDSGYGGERKGCFVAIEALVDKLYFSSKFKPDQFKQRFGDRKYVCMDHGVSNQQIHDLEKQGYVVCPFYFWKVGMEKANSKLDAIEFASTEKPSSPRYKLEQIAEEYGIPVAHERLAVEDSEQFLRMMKERLSSETEDITLREDRTNTFQMRLKTELPKDLLFHQLPQPKTGEQKMLHFLRSAVFAGLENKVFQNVFTSSGEYVTTFNVQYDPITEENNLLARNVKCASDRGAFIEFELPQELADKFQANLISDTLQDEKGKDVDQIPVDQMPAGQVPKEGLPPDIEKKTNDLNTVSIPYPPFSGESPELARTKKELGAIPIKQPESPERKDDDDKRVILKETQLSEDEKGRLAEIEKKMPEIVEAINTLSAALPEQRPLSKSVVAANKYLEWRDSTDFYGQATHEAGYLTGKSLIEIVEESNRANIQSAFSVREKSKVEDRMSQLNTTLMEMANRFAPPEDEVDDFEIVLSPSERQLAQIGILRAYAHLTTQVALPNDLFIYDGTGSKGVNIAQKAIGMHESLLRTDFKEALGTFTHEIAHNASMGHDVKFMHAMQALFSTINEKLSQISESLLNGEQLSENDSMVLELKRKWDSLLL